MRANDNFRLTDLHDASPAELRVIMAHAAGLLAHQTSQEDARLVLSRIGAALSGQQRQGRAR